VKVKKSNILSIFCILRIKAGMMEKMNAGKDVGRVEGAKTQMSEKFTIYFFNFLMMIFLFSLNNFIKLRSYCLPFSSLSDFFTNNHRKLIKNRILILNQ